jgi:hypothetical protein
MNGCIENNSEAIVASDWQVYKYDLWIWFFYDTRNYITGKNSKIIGRFQTKIP